LSYGEHKALDDLERKVNFIVSNEKSKAYQSTQSLNPFKGNTTFPFRRI
jgi:hypothetical protein